MFIILGIVILVISFILALISLIREQSKSDSELKAPNTGVKVLPVSQTVKPSVSDQQNPVSAPISQQVPRLPDEQPQEQTVPAEVPTLDTRQKTEEGFPWEDKNKRTIEEIKAELARIAGEKGKTKPSGPLASTFKSKPSILPADLQGEADLSKREQFDVRQEPKADARKNLTGEISLRNIPRQD